jgi:hypothetical protein
VEHDALNLGVVNVPQVEPINVKPTVVEDDALNLGVVKAP